MRLYHEPSEVAVHAAQNIQETKQAFDNQRAHERRQRENRPWKPEEMDGPTLRRFLGNNDFIAA